ncbi:MAG: hypothetical protein KGH72_05190 [Candidatus Micrarchaeota archaeon]|nr:hypothetical protein [Candidatus Micrarchaeota archaeon]
MTYDRKLLQKWMEVRAEVFIRKASSGIFKSSIDAKQVRQEFRLLSIELGDILEGVEKEAIAKLQDGAPVEYGPEPSKPKREVTARA